MKVTTYTARQAIFNKRGHVTAYELLFRDGVENAFPSGMDPHEATSKLIAQTHLNQGLSHVTMGKLAFINFSESCLMNNLPHALPKEKVVIEILETTPPSDEMYEICRNLFHEGYRIAFDDFVYSEKWNRFIKFAKIIKFDIQKTTLVQIVPLIINLKKNYPKLILLAEKVETREEFRHAAELGFHLFQGYFFCKPDVVSSSDVGSDATTLYRLFSEISKPSISIKNITECFQSDVGLTYKLLTYINSGILPLQSKITSIKQALVYLGEEKLKRLVVLLSTSMIAKNKTRELTRTGIIRARGAENIAALVNKELIDDAFLTGLLSIIEAVLDRPMQEILERLPVADTIKKALLEDREQSDLRIVLNTVLYAESGSWHLTSMEAKKLNLNYAQISKAMANAMDWAAHFDRVDPEELGLEKTVTA